MQALYPSRLQPITVAFSCYAATPLTTSPPLSGAHQLYRSAPLVNPTIWDAPSWATILVFETFPNLVVLGTLVEPRQHLPRCRRHIRTFIILPSELLDRIPGVEPHDRNELHLIVVERPAEELDSLVSRDLLISYTREDFFLEQLLARDILESMNNIRRRRWAAHG